MAQGTTPPLDVVYVNDFSSVWLLQLTVLPCKTGFPSTALNQSSSRSPAKSGQDSYLFADGYKTSPCWDSVTLDDKCGARV